MERVCGQNLLNTDFESPAVARNSDAHVAPTSWTWSGAFGLVINGKIGSIWPDPQNGLQYLDLGQVGSTLSQTFTVTSGGSYRLGWYDNTAFPVLRGNETSPYAVYIGNASSQVIASESFDAYNGNLAWQARSINAFLAPGSYTLRLTAQAPFDTTDTLIDNLSLTMVLVSPTLTMQPVAQSVVAGGAVVFSVVAGGSPTPTYQWRRNGVAIAGATNNTLNLASASQNDAGTYNVTVTNSVGTAVSNDALLTVGAFVPSSVILQPSSQAIPVGTGAAFTVGATGVPAPSYQWQVSTDRGANWGNLLNSATYSGVTTPTLTISATRTFMAGYQFRAVASNSGGPSAISVPATLSISASRLVNISVRGPAGTGDDTLIVGFVAGGVGSKSVLIRAVGPALAQFGLSGTLTDPQLALFSPTGAPISQNNDWGGDVALATAFAQVGAFSLPSGSKDAALLVTLQAGTNTSQISGVGGQTGVVLAETYDLDSGFPSARLINLSVRNRVGIGENILIVGFAISGTTTEALLVRGVGPGLTQFGVTGALGNPRLQLFSGTTLLMENDDWGGIAQVGNASTSVGAFPLAPASRDSALLVTLQPGSYTAQLSGVGDTTGIALVEVYEIPQ